MLSIESIDWQHGMDPASLSFMHKEIAVIGAGQIGTALVRSLAQQGHPVRWLSRSKPGDIPGGVHFAAVDVRDGEQLRMALGTAQVMIIAINPTVYDASVWAETLPSMHRGLIEAAQKTESRVVILDGLYQYALDRGPIAPETPLEPSTKKGQVRKKLVEMWDASGVRATRLCASDFWGPGLSRSLLTKEGLTALQRGKSVFVVGDPDARHAFTHVSDLVEGLIRLALADDVAGRTFHAPVTHMTARRLVELGAASLGVSAKVRKAPAWLLRLVGLFDRDTAGIVEMLPQWTYPYLVDDAAYRRHFNVEARAQW
jgi:nucleoside-diphosphate-sugar epimerase